MAKAAASTRSKLWNTVEVLTALGFGLAAYMFVPFEALDLARYYDLAETFHPDTPIIPFIEQNLDATFDFLYYLAVLITVKLGLPFQLVTAITVGGLYLMAFQFGRACEKDLHRQGPSYRVVLVDRMLVLVLIVVSTSFMLVVGIGRNASAVLPFALAIYCIAVIEQRLLGFALLVLTVFVHVGMVVFIALFLCGALLSKAWARPVSRAILLVGTLMFGLTSFTWIELPFLMFSQLPLLPVSYDYTKYLDVSGARPFFQFDLGIWDILMFLIAATTSLVMVAGIQRHDRLTAAAGAAVVFLVVALGFSQMWTQRVLLVLLPLQGLMALRAFSNHRPASLYCLVLRGCIVALACAWLLNAYSYRGLWIFRWPVGT